MCHKQHSIWVCCVFGLFMLFSILLFRSWLWYTKIRDKQDIFRWKCSVSTATTKLQIMEQIKKPASCQKCLSFEWKHLTRFYSIVCRKTCTQDKCLYYAGNDWEFSDFGCCIWVNQLHNIENAYPKLHNWYLFPTCKSQWCCCFFFCKFFLLFCFHFNLKRPKCAIDHS